MAWLLCRDTLKIKNFVEIALCSTVFEILAFLCFAIFAQKFENSKWPPFLARQNFFENWHGHSAEIPCGSNISSKSLYLARFSRYKHFYVLQFCEKFKNSKWPPFFARNFFFENWHGHSAEIPCGSNISSKSLYLARFSRYKHFYVLQFCEKFENSKWPPFFARNFFFENWHGYSAEIPCGSKILSKSLYLAGFSRYKHFYVLQFLRKIRKFKMAAICGDKISLKMGMATLQRYPVCQKFCRNRSI